MVPNGWSEGQVQDFLFLQRGFDLTAKQAVDGNIPVYSSSGLAYFHNESKVQGPGIVTGRKGSVGPVYLINENFWPHDTTLWVKDFKGNDIKYIEYFLKFLRLERFDEASSVPTLNRNNVHGVKCVFPPLPEQKKIAQILSTWDKAITTTEQLLANSQQQKKALMQQLLTGKKHLLDKNGVRFSGEWKDVEIGRVLKEVKRPVDWDDEAEYKLLSVKRRSEGVVLREILKGSDILTKKMNVAHSGDFLISKMQIVHGAAGLVSDEFDGFHVSDSYISLIPKDESKLNIHFFAWFAKQKLMYHKAFLCSYGVHIEKMTFNFKLFLKEKIRVPVSIEEQQKIAAVLSSADQEISALQQKLDALKQEKKALMQQLLTGKRRVKIDDKEIA
ncbi:restriction endonuclease subunit S [Vibrio diabolicus]